MRKQKIRACVLALILLLACAYCVTAFTDWIPALSSLRDRYIATALSTMNHKWLATAFFPDDVVQAVREDLENARLSQVGQNSGDWILDPATGTGFFSLFPELEESAVREWVQAHPDAVENGWDHFYVNQAGLDDSGLELHTDQGDQVLAIDAANGLLVVRIREDAFRGVLILGRDPARLRCAPAAEWGTAGQKIGDIAAASGALAALTASGFDAEGPEGAWQTGAAMCSGTAYGEHLKTGYKRLEKHTDNKLYVVDAPTDFHPECTDATEWTPALIVDGITTVSEADHYNVRNPRCCLGQARDGTVLMLCIEGRYFDSLGATAPECAQILSRYGAYQAMNLDGGTSAICWYQGECITRCSDPELPEGRCLPNAWLYQ